MNNKGLTDSPTEADFRNNNWSKIDPFIEADNKRLPDNWEWECGGTCARLYSQDQGYASIRAWAHMDGRFSAGYGDEKWLGSHGEDLEDFVSAMNFVTDQVLKKTS